jgi:hypothetical protein
MCGKFTAMASWSGVVDFSDAFSETVAPGGNDQPVGFKVMSQLNIIIWDQDTKARRVVPMRWGYPRRGSWRSPGRHRRQRAKPTVRDPGGLL